jgi:hypothetical protein
LLPFAADLGMAGVPFVIGVALSAYLVHLVLAYVPTVIRTRSDPPQGLGDHVSRPQPFRIQRAAMPEKS